MSVVSLTPRVAGSRPARSSELARSTPDGDLRIGIAPQRLRLEPDMADATNTDSSNTGSAKTPTNENTLDIESAAVTARQAVATAYGDPTSVVEIVKAELPLPDTGQAVIDVTAIGVNPIDAKTVSGAMGGDTSKLPLPIGHELAGVVRAVGSSTGDTPPTTFTPGDEVIVYPAPGAFADHVVVDLTSVHSRPAGLDAEHGAGLLLVGVTAADVVATAAITPDDTVLIHGGAGAVGSIAVQLALRIGATVVATASPANHEYLRELGATPVAYGDGLLDRVRAAAPDGVTAAIDTVGTDEAIDVSLELVADRARIVSIAAFGRGEDGIVLVNGSTPQSKENRAAAVDGLIADAASGALVTDIAATYPLDRAGQALEDLLTSHPRGKFVLLP